MIKNLRRLLLTFVLLSVYIVFYFSSKKINERFLSSSSSSSISFILSSYNRTNSLLQIRDNASTSLKEKREKEEVRSKVNHNDEYLFQQLEQQEKEKENKLFCKKPGHTLININAEAKSSSSFTESVVGAVMDAICKESDHYSNNHCEYILHIRKYEEEVHYLRFTDQLGHSCNITMVRSGPSKGKLFGKHVIPHTKIRANDIMYLDHRDSIDCENCNAIESQCGTDSIDDWIINCPPEKLNIAPPSFPTQLALEWNNVTDEKFILILRDPRETVVSSVNFAMRNIKNKRGERKNDEKEWDDLFFKCAKCIPKNIAFRYSWMAGPLSQSNGLDKRVLPIYLLSNGAGYTLTTSSTIVSTDNDNNNESSDGFFEMINAIAEFIGIDVPREVLSILATAMNPYTSINTQCKNGGCHQKKCVDELIKNNFTHEEMKYIQYIKWKHVPERLKVSGTVEELKNYKKKTMFGFPYELPKTFAEHLDNMTHKALPENLRDLWNVGSFDKDY